MEPFAPMEPSTDLERAPEDMLADLERLADAAELKVEISSDSVRARYEKELVPKLEEMRVLVAQKSPVAKNALEDTIVMFREWLITAGARVVDEPLD